MTEHDETIERKNTLNRTSKKINELDIVLFKIYHSICVPIIISIQKDFAMLFGAVFWSICYNYYNYNYEHVCFQ